MYPIDLTADERDKVQAALITGYAYGIGSIKEALSHGCHHDRHTRCVVRNIIKDIRAIDAALDILRK